MESYVPKAAGIYYAMHHNFLRVIEGTQEKTFQPSITSSFEETRTSSDSKFML